MPHHTSHSRLDYHDVSPILEEPDLSHPLSPDFSLPITGHTEIREIQVLSASDPQEVTDTPNSQIYSYNTNAIPDHEVVSSVTSSDHVTEATDLYGGPVFFEIPEDHTHDTRV